MTRLRPILVLGAALLPACAERTPDAVPADTAPPTSAPAPDADMTVTSSGVGPVRIGMTLAEVHTALVAPLTQPVEMQQECDYANFPAAGGSVFLMVHRDTVVRVDIAPAGLRTDGGVGVGSSAAEVETAHGTLERQPHKYVTGEYLVTAPDQAGNRLVFETDSAGTVTAYRAGREPYVRWVEGCS